MLSGAGLIQKDDIKVHVHTTSSAIVSGREIDLTDALGSTDVICETAPIFVSLTEEDGSIKGLVEGEVTVLGKKLTLANENYKGKTVFVDYYIVKSGANVDEMQIDMANFAGYYYVEAATLFRRQSDGVDLPAEITFPNVKIQSNFTFSMASTGDPSTFTFTMDAMPGYTFFDNTKKVLCVMQIVNDVTALDADAKSVMLHDDGENEFTFDDSVKKN